MKYGSLYERLVANCAPAPDQNENGCWLWTGSTNRPGPSGYPRLNVYACGTRKTTAAHRLMAELVAEQPIPEDHEVDHLCNVRRCINPDHLEVVTRAENLRRRDARMYAA